SRLKRRRRRSAWRPRIFGVRSMPSPTGTGRSSRATEMSDRDETGQRVLQPPGWPRPRGYANGIIADGQAIFLAGQTGGAAQGHFAEGMAGQVRQALANIVALLTEAGASPLHLVRLTWFVTDLQAYRDNQPGIGEAYRATIGRHFPAMSVIGVSQLVEPG